MAKFTTGHLRAIARTLADLPVNDVLPKQHRGKLPYTAVHYWNLLDAFCVMLKESNPNFDREKFLKACDSAPFDDVVMGVPVIYSYCKKCKAKITNVLDDGRPDDYCSKHR